MKRRLIEFLLSYAILLPQSMVWTSASGPTLGISQIELPSSATWGVITDNITAGPVCLTHNNPFEMSQYYNLSGKPVETGFAYRPDDCHFPCGLGVIKWDGKYDYIDAERNLVIDCIYDAGYTFKDGLALVEKDGGELLIDISGETFMSLSGRQLNAYSGFSEGFYAVSSEAEGENWGSTGYIDKSGELAVLMRYMSTFDFYDEIVIVREYYNGKGSTGTMDKEENIIIPHEYDDVESYTANKNYLTATDETRNDIYRGDGTLLHSFPKSRYDRVRIGEINDLIFVEKNYGCGYLDMDGQEIVSMMYYVPQESGIGGGSIVQRVPYQTPAGTNMWGTIALDDETAFVPFPDETACVRFPLSGGGVVVKQQSARKHSYMDQTGAWVVPPRFDQAKSFENGYELVCQDGRVGILKNPSDLPSPWATDAVSMARELGLLPRQVDSCYTAAVTRQHFSELVVCLAETADDKKIDTRSVSPFTDTADVAVRKAHAADIVTGTGDGTTFSPDTSITREQIVVILCRAVQYIQKQTGRSVLAEVGGLDSFTDAGQIPGWAAGSLVALAASGILQDTSSAALSPKNTTTAEQAILLTLRAYQEFSK